MDKGGNRRNGKLIPAGHSTRVEGLNDLLQRLMQWPEISSIRTGAISYSKGRGGGGFSFKATRLARIGSLVTGIQCHATNGTNTQLVILNGPNLEALKQRLCNEGYGANW